MDSKQWFLFLTIVTFSEFKQYLYAPAIKEFYAIVRIPKNFLTCNRLQEDKCSKCLLTKMFHLPHEPSLSLLRPLHDMTKKEKNQYFFEAMRRRMITSLKGVTKKYMHLVAQRKWTSMYDLARPKTVNKLVRASLRRKSRWNLQYLLACLRFPSKNQCNQSTSSLHEELAYATNPSSYSDLIFGAPASHTKP